MYADRVEAGAKRSVYDRLNGSSIDDSARGRQFTGKRDKKMEESLNQNCRSKEEEQGITTTRIFVGGLGGSVTSDDIHKMLSSLGTVKAVDIVRTKGRSFAYLDFLPSSAKSLSKLFSMYNGCFWKGGRLKLEKAKEHYLVRLRQEWAEDTELAKCQPSNSIDKNTNIVSSYKPKKIVNPEKSQLRIFFPKLRKIKSLPFNGTGKHKYSFQRIEVPSLPTYFCDCEEHSGPPHTTQKQLFCDPEPQTGGMNEEELNIMNSVMKKIFERETDLKCYMTWLTKGEHHSLKSTNELLIHDSESNHAADSGELPVHDDELDLAEDEDNLVINMFSGRDTMPLLGSQEQGAIPLNQDVQKSRFNGTRTSTDMPARNTLPSTKKRKSCHIDDSQGNELLSAIPGKKPSLQTHLEDWGIQLGGQTSELRQGIQKTTANLSWSQKSSWRDLVGDKGSNPFIISDMLPGVAAREQGQVKFDFPKVPDIIESKKPNLVNHENLEALSGKVKGLKGLAEAQPPIAGEVVRSGRGASWLQKSSWTQLVSEANSNSFSISQILPRIPPERQKQPKFSDGDRAVSGDSKHQDQVKQHTSETIRDGNESLEVGKGITTTTSSCDIVTLDEENKFVDVDIEKSTPEKVMQITAHKEVSAPTLTKKPQIFPKQSIKDIEIGVTCSFMRTTASVKEWSKTKAALSGSLKKKNNDKVV